MSERGGVVVTCEHGGNRIPSRYTPLFKGQEALLATHRGWDAGALPLARALAQKLGAPLVSSTESRLLVDLNRSLHHPRVFSEFTCGLPPDEKERILRRWYFPHREKVLGEVEAFVESGRAAVHLGVHTFTPVLNGRVREVEIGLLYDPDRSEEKAFCAELGAALRSRLDGVDGPVRVRMNKPYRGRSDGLTTWLRRQFPPEHFMGIELEVNQRLAAGGAEGWPPVRAAILHTFGEMSMRWGLNLTT